MIDKTKTKVLFLITKSNWGGAQRYVFDLATNLPATQYDVAVALGGDGPLTTKLEAAGVRVIPIAGLTRDVSLRAEITATRTIARIIRRESPDILHVNSSKAGALGALLGRLLRVQRVIFTAHGWAFNEDRSWPSRLLIKTIHWLTVVFVHRTITVSDAVARQMNWPFVQHKLHTVRLGRAVPDTYPRATARAQLATHCPTLQSYVSDNWLISIGELHPVKQHLVAIKAVQSLLADGQTVRYIIIGTGELRDTLTQYITQHHLTEHIFLLGHLDAAAQYLTAADVFVLPSHSEALGYVAIEASLAGVPIVASDVGGIPEVVAHNQTGYLVPRGNAPALATALQTYLADPALRAAHGDAAQQQVDRWSIAQMVAATTAIYNNELLR